MWTGRNSWQLGVVVALLIGTACGGGADPDLDPDPDPSTIDNDQDGFTADVDCDDNDASVYPGAPEICDGKDNSCNSLIDDEDPEVVDQPAWYPDEDLDGFGDPEREVLACIQPADLIVDGTDCDDTDPTVYPGAPEICDGQDNSCNDLIDDEDPLVEGQSEWFRDADGDGLGDPESSVLACEQPDGYVDNALDCDDTDPEAGEASAWYRDADGDGFGDPDVFVFACEQPDGHVANDLDCNDADPEINPDAIEVCDSQDNDCDGLRDDEDPDVVGQTAWFPDEDGDGYGDERGEATFLCVAPDGMVDDDTDCDDTDRVVHPGRFDFGDGKDNDCDGDFDEDVGTEEYRHDVDIQPIFNSSCTGCHGSSGGLSLASSAWPRLFNVESSVRGLSYITPGDHQGSYLWHKLKGTHADVGGGGGRMPPSGALPDRTLDIIDTWIWEGAVR